MVNKNSQYLPKQKREEFETKQILKWRITKLWVSHVCDGELGLQIMH